MFFRNMELVLPSSNLSRPPTIQWGLYKCPMDDLLTSESQKLHPQIMLTLPFSEHTSHEKACSASAEHRLFHLFLSSNHLSPHLRPPCSLIPSISQAPCLQGSGFEICSWMSPLGCLVSKTFLCCRPQCLSVPACCASGKRTWFHNKRDEEEKN